MKRRIGTGAVAALTVVLSMSACSGSSSKSVSPTTSGGAAASASTAGSSAASTAASTTSAGAADLSPARANTECDKAPDTCNTGTATKGGHFAYVLEKDI
ncbi:MAG: hypothetical protein QOD91_126, partial [Frankiales bacterium]|nr:hypothetical protein [Frankiales bacterium]